MWLTGNIYCLYNLISMICLHIHRLWMTFEGRCRLCLRLCLVLRWLALWASDIALVFSRRKSFAMANSYWRNLIQLPIDWGNAYIPWGLGAPMRQPFDTIGTKPTHKLQQNPSSLRRAALQSYDEATVDDSAQRQRSALTVLSRCYACLWLPLYHFVPLDCQRLTTPVTLPWSAAVRPPAW